MNNRSQAVRIPKDFELPGDEVTIVRLPDGSLLLRPRRELDALLATLAPLGPEDALEDVQDLDIEPVHL
ncbi:AbrB/MazE/SpoVT family DNA-binding domain-containing protein [Methylobacterium sp. NEAU 140]|uniref:antitoxin n=1 Tax=Methylobacterium sp. NEAU 140 TaxID=3064945 RepID=UPI0027373707|nr:AbrB/MazE/SpoVT family DNA-binding domain-containing protein [Methylobacterium sp. NEAU 140]MDP4022291.1 AbrB/MazE/SpoVT family DNA-binding domain-containing protein [Methylobacterium sp. NEAU 140]